MYTIIKYQGVKKFLTTEAPALATSLLISEGLYKFGSFILECSAFLITWYGISFLISKFAGKKAPIT